MKQGTYSAHFVKIAQGMCLCGAFTFRHLVKFQQNFQFLGSYTLIDALMGVKFGMPTLLPLRGEKKIKIGL